MKRDDLITVPAACKELGVHHSYLWRLIYNGTIIPTVPGRRGPGGQTMLSRELVEKIRRWRKRLEKVKQEVIR